MNNRVYIISLYISDIAYNFVKVQDKVEVKMYITDQIRIITPKTDITIHPLSVTTAEQLESTIAALKSIKEEVASYL